MVREFEHKNHWAVILGGSSGLGLATAKKLARHGCNICIVHRNRKADLPDLEKLFSEIRAEGVAFLSFNIDACNSEKRKALLLDLQKHLGEKGKVRILVHSLAKGNLKPMVSEEDQAVLQNDDFMLTINAMAVSLYDWTKALFDAKLFANDTRIISFTSEGNSKAWPNYAAVSAAKTALEAISRNIALEFAPYGIRANCIQAGITDTHSLRLIPGSEQLKKYALKRNPLSRLTRPEDVANAVYLLSLDEAAWINGCIIPVDGGEHMS